MSSCSPRALARAVVSFAFLLALAGVPIEARACSICQPGDPLYSPEGASAQRAGAFSLYLENRHTWKSSGVLTHGEHAHPSDRERAYDRDVTLWASYSPLDRLTLSASLPYRWISNDHQDHGDWSRTRNRGFGDAAAYATFVLWRDIERAPTAWLEARAMLEAPTGSDEKSFHGEADPHVQLGSGSWDMGAGLAFTKRFEWGQIYASGFYRWNRNGALRYRYGDSAHANLIASAPTYTLPGLGVLVRPGAELNFRYAGRDEFEDSAYRDSGGSIGFVTPFVELPLTRTSHERAPWLRIATRMPLGDGGLHGHQHEGFVFFAGLGLPF